MFTNILAAAAETAGDTGKIQGVEGLDIAVIILYIVAVVGLGLYAGVLMKKKKSEGEGRDYFLAGGTLKWPVIGLALFATNISCVHLVSLAQSGFDTGLLNGNFEWMAAFTLILLALFFAPFYIKSKVATLPDFLEKRYNRSCRDMLSAFSLISAVVIHIGFSFLTGGIVLRDIFGVDLYLAISVIAIITAVYTIVGGLLAVVWTEAIQTVILILGAGVITWMAYDQTGGWSGMNDVLAQTNDLGEDNTHKLSMLRPSGDPDGLSWIAVFLGYPILGIWYWCADQTIVQRVLGAKDENHARVGSLFAGLIKVIPVFIFVLPGVFAFTMFKSGKLDMEHSRKADIVDVRVAYKKGDFPITADELKKWEEAKVATFKEKRSLTLDLKVAATSGVLTEAQIESAKKLGEPVYDTKGVYTAMITQLLPVGLKGLIIAALLAALMSTVSGALNSISTLTAFDLYKRVKPEASDAKLVTVGRVAAGVAVILSIALVPVLDKAPSLFNALNSIIAHIAAPVTCVFVLGVFWKRANAVSAQWTLIIGSVAGVLVYTLNSMGIDTPLKSIPFMIMAFYLFVFCVVVQVTIALTSKEKVSAEAAELCWNSPLEPLLQPGWKGLGNYKFLSVLLLAVMAVLYYIFR